MGKEQGDFVTRSDNGAMIDRIHPLFTVETSRTTNSRPGDGPERTEAQVPTGAASNLGQDWAGPWPEGVASGRGCKANDRRRMTGAVLGHVMFDRHHPDVGWSRHGASSMGSACARQPATSCPLQLAEGRGCDSSAMAGRSKDRRLACGSGQALAHTFSRM